MISTGVISCNEPKKLQRHVPGTFQGHVFATMETLITIANPTRCSGGRPIVGPHAGF